VLSATVVFDKLFSLFGSSGPVRVDVKKRFDYSGAKSGQGTMSAVYRAKDRQHGNKVVCLKILDKEKTAAFEKRFVGLKKPSEGEICVQLKHDHIVRTLEHGITTNGEPFLVMEWLDGIGLQALVEANSPRLKSKRNELLAQIADALAYMHGQKWLHRDICPRNVIVTAQDQAKLIDFGLTIPYTLPFCKPGNRTGTSQYLAPEIIKRSSTDHRVDLFALGVTAYEVFTGQLPWGKMESIDERLRQMAAPPKDPRELRPELDDATARLLMKGVERDVAKRFQNATDFRDAVKALPRKH
jgi:serine/threonine protein kinase